MSLLLNLIIALTSLTAATAVRQLPSTEADYYPTGEKTEKINECVKGVPPFCCENGSESPYCCLNGSWSPYCCENGSHRSDCSDWWIDYTTVSDQIDLETTSTEATTETT